MCPSNGPAAAAEAEAEEVVVEEADAKRTPWLEKM